MNAHERTTKREEVTRLTDEIRRLQREIQAAAQDPTREGYAELVQGKRDEIAQLEEQRKEIKRQLLQDEIDNL